MLCVVDDAQWLDRESARALGFIARRLLADRIALVFAAREVEGLLAGLPELQVGALGHRDSRALLESVLPARLDEGVLGRIIVETHGNPLALLELPHGLTPAQLAGGFGLPAAQPLSDRIQESFARRLAHYRGMPGGWYSLRLRIRLAILRSCGARLRFSESPRTPHVRPKRKGF